MSQFDFLSVLVAIIIALGVSHILTSAAQLIRRRHQVKMHLTTLVWMGVLLLLLVQVWWAAYYRREVGRWTIFSFLLYLLIPILLSVLGYLLVSPNELELHAEFDLEKEYYDNRRWFFGILGTVVIVSLGEDAIRSKSLTLDLNAGMRLAFLVLCGAGFAIPVKRVQSIIALSFLVVLLCYLGFVFRQL
jgi:hypothetical protein